MVRREAGDPPRPAHVLTTRHEGHGGAWQARRTSTLQRSGNAARRRRARRPTHEGMVDAGIEVRPLVIVVLPAVADRLAEVAGYAPTRPAQHDALERVEFAGGGGRAARRSRPATRIDQVRDVVSVATEPRMARWRNGGRHDDSIRHGISISAKMVGRQLSGECSGTSRISGTGKWNKKSGK